LAKTLARAKHVAERKVLNKRGKYEISFSLSLPSKMAKAITSKSQTKSLK
jgi:hypothetical protein